MTVVGGRVFFAANDGGSGFELWKSDGTANGTSLVKNIYPDVVGIKHSSPDFLSPVYGEIYFAATNDNGRELWKSDGTAAGTVTIEDIVEGAASSEPMHLFTVNGGVLFTADVGATGRELWKSNGTVNGTEPVKDLDQNGSSNPQYFTQGPDGLVYFIADSKLWVTDGTESGTLSATTPIGFTGVTSARMAFLGSDLFLSASDNDHGTELWSTTRGGLFIKGRAWNDVGPDPYGIQDPGETGIASVTVRLFDDSFSELASTTTDSEGEYLLSVPSAGDYYIEFGPVSGTFTWQNQGDDSYDSDVDPSTGQSSLLTLVWGQDPIDVDAGIVENTAPVAFDDEYETLHDQALIESASGVLLNDYDDDMDPLEVSWNSDPSNGSLTLNADGSFTYTPDQGFVGQDSFTYKVTDGVEESNAATVTIDVTNFIPIAFDDEYYTMEDTQLTEPAGTGLLSNDYDDDMDPLEVYSYSQPSNGSVTVNSDGSFTYTPDTGYTGFDSFTYDITDGVAVSSAATVQIDVQPGMPLRASEPTTSQEAPDVLTSAELAPIVDEAIIRWTTAGASARQVLSLQVADVLILDLPSDLLGFANGGTIWIDSDAAGHGWFIDATPSDDVEFNVAVNPSGVDLLTVVAHEMGHVLGLSDLDPILNPDNVMAATLGAGQRRGPTTENLMFLNSSTALTNPPVSTPTPTQPAEEELAFA